MPATGLTRRALLGAFAAMPYIGRARAQSNWPERPVRVMVPYPPAGGLALTDVMAGQVKFFFAKALRRSD